MWDEQTTLILQNIVYLALGAFLMIRWLWRRSTVQ